MRYRRVTSSCQRISAFNVRVLSERFSSDIVRKLRENTTEMAAAAVRMVSAGSRRLLGARRAE